MRVFKTRWLTRFAKRAKIDDATLLEAIKRAERGLVDADLGGGVIKQRIGREGQGRSGGYRTLIAVRSGDRAFFMFAFAKNERDNIDPDDLHELKELAGRWLAATDAGIATALEIGEIEEIGNAES